MKWAIAIHGGAGSIKRTFDSKPHEAVVRDALNRAVEVLTHQREGILKSRSPLASKALVAAVEAVLVMEDNPLFNAGKGSCLTTAGVCEMEAAVMESTLSSGACTGLTTVKNPVLFAEHVRVNTPHCMIGFEAADALAEQAGFDRESKEWFLTEKRRGQREKVAATGDVVRDHDVDASTHPSGDTVGAVVLDEDGVLAGAVSTGGMTNKFEGRIGDSPCIGSGLYVTPLAAVCGSGDGEDFIRHNSCAQVSHAMKYGNMDLKTAVHHVLFGEMTADSGGLIAVSKDGEIVMDINCEGMFRAMANSNGETSIETW